MDQPSSNRFGTRNGAPSHSAFGHNHVVPPITADTPSAPQLTIDWATRGEHNQAESMISDEGVGLVEDAPEGSGNPSRARDHLANERTYLAWLRTALAVMALGLAIAGFANSTSTSSVVAGAILVAVGAAGVLYGTARYRQVNREIEAAVYETGSRGNAAIVASTVLVTAVVLALIVLITGR